MKSYDIYLNLKKEDDALNILRYTFGASMLQDENDEYKLDTSPGLNYLINYFKNENIFRFSDITSASHLILP